MAVIGVALLVLECVVVFLFGLDLSACFCSGGSQHVKVKVDCRCNSNSAREGHALASVHEPC